MEEKNIRNLRKEEAEKESALNKFVGYTKKGVKFFGTKAKEYGKKAYDNREKIAATVTGAAGVILVVKKSTDALGITNKTQYQRTVDQRKYQYYDYSSKRYFTLKREPYPMEIEEIEYRKRTGEPLVSILSDMNLLKRW